MAEGYKNSKNPKTSGFTLMEALIGIALMVIVFFGIYGLIQLGMKMVAQSKARVTATALANEKIEVVRNLPYDQVGTLGGIPAGSLEETETITRNKIPYTVKTTVVYVDDPFDGLMGSDPLPWDYKRIRVKVSWTGFLGGQVSLQSDASPKGIETTGSGGIISILVFDASGQPLSGANVHIENPTASPPIDANYQTDDQGQLFVPGAPACNDCYKITATKADYSSDRTYAVGELVHGVALAMPDKPYLSVLEGQMSEISFTIDRLATKTVQALRYVEEKTWSDTFEDETKISQKFQVVASSSGVLIELEQENPGQYFSAGYFLSATITPASLVEWGRLSWTDSTSIATEITYQVLYFYGGDWILIPDADLTVAGVPNSTGFSAGPVELAELDPDKYSSVKIKANFSTSDLAQTPLLYDWQITWFSTGASNPVPNLDFSMQGAKILGYDASNKPVYKYLENFTTDGNGQKTIAGLEWDSYRITVNGLATGYDIANSLPPQPVSVNPGASQTTTFKLAIHKTNTLLVTVKDAANQPLVGASVRVFKTGYDKTKLSSDSGQAFFSPLTVGTSTLKVKMAGFEDWPGDIWISGQTEQTAVMTPP